MFIKLSMVLPAQQRHIYEDTEVETAGDEGEDDGIVQLHPTQPGELTKPTVVNVDHIRNFYPRKRRQDGTQPIGTRITFSSGAGVAVSDTMEEVIAKLEAAAS